MNIALKTLALTLILAILATGGLAVHMTHVYVQITFGTPPEISAPQVNVAELMPLPLKRRGN